MRGHDNSTLRRTLVWCSKADARITTSIIGNGYGLLFIARNYSLHIICNACCDYLTIPNQYIYKP